MNLLENGLIYSPEEDPMEAKELSEDTIAKLTEVSSCSNNLDSPDSSDAQELDIIIKIFTKEKSTRLSTTQDGQIVLSTSTHYSLESRPKIQYPLPPDVPSEDFYLVDQGISAYYVVRNGKEKQKNIQIRYIADSRKVQEDKFELVADIKCRANARLPFTPIGFLNSDFYFFNNKKIWISSRLSPSHWSPPLPLSIFSGMVTMPTFDIDDKHLSIWNIDSTSRFIQAYFSAHGNIPFSGLHNWNSVQGITDIGDMILTVVGQLTGHYIYHLTKPSLTEGKSAMITTFCPSFRRKCPHITKNLITNVNGVKYILHDFYQLDDIKIKKTVVISFVEVKDTKFRLRTVQVQLKEPLNWEFNRIEAFSGSGEQGFVFWEDKNSGSSTYFKLILTL